MCVRWCEYTYLIMWKCVCGNANARIRWNGYAYLVMQGYGRDESAPTPDGMFATNFVGVRNVIAIRSQCFGKPSAAVGDRFIAPAYTKTPTKWRTEMCMRWNEYTYLIMWKCVYVEMDTRIRWNGYTFLVISGYGRDESVPYAWRNVRNQFRGCSPPILWICNAS